MADAGPIRQEALASYLERVCGGPVELLALRSLAGAGTSTDPKGLGYGVPFEVECVAGGRLRSGIVVRRRRRLAAAAICQG